MDDNKILVSRIEAATHTAMTRIQDVMKIQARMRKEDYSPHDVDQMCSDLMSMSNSISQKVDDKNISDINQIPVLLTEHLESEHKKIAIDNEEQLKKKIAEDSIIMEAWGSALGIRNQVLESFKTSPLGMEYSKLMDQKKTGRA